jgi:hypothetical protein
MKSSVVAILFVVLSCSKCSLAEVITLDGRFLVNGSALSQFQEFHGTTTGIFVDIGSGLVPTGDITFALDPSKISTWMLDFTNNTQTYDLHLLATFTLQAAIGAQPAPINIIETGAIQGFNIANAGSLVISTQHVGMLKQPLLPDQSTTGSAQGPLVSPVDPVFLDFESTNLVGGGVVSAGPFAGFEYTNKWHVDKVTISVPGVTIEISNTPEIDPATGSGALSLIAGVLAMIEQRRRRGAASTAIAA